MPAMITPMMSTGDPFHLLGTALFGHFASTRPAGRRRKPASGSIAQLRFADHCLNTCRDPTSRAGHSKADPGRDASGHRRGHPFRTLSRHSTHLTRSSSGRGCHGPPQSRRTNGEERITEPDASPDHGSPPARWHSSAATCCYFLRSMGGSMASRDAVLSSDDFGSSVEPAATLHPYGRTEIGSRWGAQCLRVLTLRSVIVA
jgi:hypothetical protein